MDVLWGAWIKNISYHSETQSYDISGIYDTIYKEGKSDFPFIEDLYVTLQLQAELIEIARDYKLTLALMDMDGITHIFVIDEDIKVPVMDIPIRWYKAFKYQNILIPRPDYYELQIAIDGQYKQRIPLWVIAPQMFTNTDKDTKK